jgi:hypothetical protein
MGFDQLLQSGEDSDVVVAIGERKFPLHALILKNQSPYFRGVLTSGMSMKEGDRIIELKPTEVAERSFEAILPFMYSQCIGPIDSLTAEELFNIFEVANYLQLIDFEEHMSQQDASNSLWGSAQKSPYRSLKRCIEQHVKEIEESKQKMWLVEQCQQAHRFTSDVPAKPLKQAFLEVLCEECRKSSFYDFQFVTQMLEKVLSLPIQDESALQQLSRKDEVEALKGRLSETQSKLSEAENKLNFQDLIQKQSGGDLM